MSERPAPGRLYFGVPVPYLDVSGFEAVSLVDGRVEGRLAARPDLDNRNGYAHGGRVMTAMDSVMSAAARSADPTGLAVSTISMTTNFLLGATGELMVTGTRVRQGRSIAFCEAQVRDAEGRVIATATASFSVRPRNTEGRS